MCYTVPGAVCRTTTDIAGPGAVLDRSLPCAQHIAECVLTTDVGENHNQDQNRACNTFEAIDVSGDMDESKDDNKRRLERQLKQSIYLGIVSVARILHRPFLTYPAQISTTPSRSGTFAPHTELKKTSTEVE